MGRGRLDSILCSNSIPGIDFYPINRQKIPARPPCTVCYLLVHVLTKNSWAFAIPHTVRVCWRDRNKLAGSLRGSCLLYKYFHMSTSTSHIKHLDKSKPDLLHVRGVDPWHMSYWKNPLWLLLYDLPPSPPQTTVTYVIYGQTTISTLREKD